jgi:diguanylate cyclase (GGDEF)-like protein
MSAGLLLITLISYEGMGTIKKRLDVVYFGNIVPATKLMTISEMYNKNILNTVHRYQNDLISAKDARMNIQDANDVILDSWHEYSYTYHSPGEQEIVDFADRKITQTMDVISLLILLLDTDEKTEINKLVHKELYPAIEPVITITEKLIAYEFTLASEEKKRANDIYVDTRNLLLASLLVIFIIAIVIFIPIMRGIQKSDKRLRSLNDRLTEISITDPLTGLHNRRYFELVVRSELNRARRAGESVAFAMMDIDYFKLYNDHYGHQKGDSALKAVADSIKSNLKRAGDYAFRLGGEEFAVLVTGIGEESARLFYERIRESVEKLSLPHEKNPAGVMTISIGVSYVARIGEQSLDQMVKCADASLYNAKHSGRNQTLFRHFTMETAEEEEAVSA